MTHTVEAMCKSHQYNFDLNDKFLEANEEGCYVPTIYVVWTNWSFYFVGKCKGFVCYFGCF